MKHSPSTQHLQKFVYIDSSEEEDNPQNEQVSKKIPRACTAHSNTLKKDSDYHKQISEMVKDQIQKLEHGDALLVPPKENQMEDALKKRQGQYQWFLKQMHIDKRYQNIMGNKVAKIKEQNKRKEEKLIKKRLSEQYKEEENKLRKHVIDKEDKQDKVLKNLHKAVHHLGQERNILTAQKVKSVIQSQREKTADHVASLQSKQRNQLQELKEKYNAMKEETRLNKLEQGKVLRDLEHKNREMKDVLQERLTVKKDFKV